MRVAGRIGVLGAALLLLTLNALPAWSQDAGTCHAECKQARRSCHHAGHAAFRACRSGCAEAVAQALVRARTLCREEALERDECARLVGEAVHIATDACHQDCRSARERARNLCEEERGECARACDGVFDFECVDACRDEFAGCRGDVHACAGECRQLAKEALAECREMADLETNPEALRECVRAAHGAARECKAECHAGLPCSGDLRECLGTCGEE